MSHDETVAASLARIEEKLEGFLFRMELVEKLPDRVTKLEHGRTWILGAFAVVVAVASVVMKVLIP